MPTLEEVTGLDAVAGTATSYTVLVGDVFMGELDGRWDIDWIRVELVEGKPYQISLTSTEDNAEADLVLRVVNSAGNEVAANDDIDFAAGNLNSQVRFFLDEPGVYYIIAESFRGNPTKQTSGAYSLVLYDREMKTLRTVRAWAVRVMTCWLVVMPMTSWLVERGMTGSSAKRGAMH